MSSFPKIPYRHHVFTTPEKKGETIIQLREENKNGSCKQHEWGNCWKRLEGTLNIRNMGIFVLQINTKKAGASYMGAATNRPTTRDSYGPSVPFLLEGKYSQSQVQLVFHLFSPQDSLLTCTGYGVLSVQTSFTDHFLQGCPHQFRKWHEWQGTKKEKLCSRAQSSQQTGVRNVYHPRSKSHLGELKIQLVHFWFMKGVM